MEKKKNPIISIIVPVYNVERYLEDCLNSVINQAVKEVEIILIDDGSVDSSGIICDQYAEKDERIVVFHTQNSGVSAARNIGLKHAKGEFVSFVDSDDVITSDAYTKLLAHVNQSTLVMGKLHSFVDDRILPDEVAHGLSIISKNEFLTDLFAEEKYPYLGYPVGKLFLREIIEKDNLTFDESIKVNEDRLFVLKYAMKCENICLLDDVVYSYRQREDSVVNEIRRSKCVSDSEMTIIFAFEEMKKLCRTYSSDLYYLCSRKAFEYALYLKRRISFKEKDKLKKVNEFLYNNSFICIKNPNTTCLNKIKVIAHTILGR